jgi:surface polysaccharide O-acyltransferase-like enzyme
MAGVASTAAGSSGKRISGLDTARALAIALAMMAHCFIHFGVWDHLSQDTVVTVRAFVRSATPTFITLFGMMLEIVYLKMLRRGERQACWIRLLTRAIQCYLLYLCVVAAGIIGGQLAPGEGAKAALFLSQAYFANILKFYSLGLVVGIALVELRAHYGLRAVAGVIVVIWLSYPLIQALPALPHTVRHLASFLIGAGAETGPSVLQGMSFAALGMFLGRGALGLLDDDKVARRRALTLLACVMVLVALPTAGLMANLGPWPALEKFTNYGYRAANHPIYYLVGSSFALSMIAGCTLVAARLPAALLARLNVFGISSLFAYGFGNIALNLLPPLRGSLSLGLAATLTFMLCLYGLTVYFQRAVRAQAADGPRRSLTARLGGLHDALRRLTVWLAGLFVARLLVRRRTA